jgi:hypothetical protein
MPVQRVVGRIEIEDDLPGRVLVRLHKQIDKQRLDLGAIPGDTVIASQLRPAPLEPVERRFAGQWRTILAPGRQLAGQRRHRRVVTQLVVIDQVFVARRQREKPLPNQRSDGVLDQLRDATVGETLANRSTSRIARSVAPSSSAPASELILPPSNPTTTARPSTRAKPNRSALHSVCAAPTMHPTTPTKEEVTDFPPGVKVNVKRPMGCAASQLVVSRERGGMVVENDLDRGIGRVDRVEELDSMNSRVAVAFLDQGMDVTGELRWTPFVRQPEPLFKV